METPPAPGIQSAATGSGNTHTAEMPAIGRQKSRSLRDSCGVFSRLVRTLSSAVAAAVAIFIHIVSLIRDLTSGRMARACDRA